MRHSQESAFFKGTACFRAVWERQRSQEPWGRGHACQSPKNRAERVGAGRAPAGTFAEGEARAARASRLWRKHTKRTRRGRPHQPEMAGTLPLRCFPAGLKVAVVACPPLRQALSGRPRAAEPKASPWRETRPAQKPESRAPGAAQRRPLTGAASCGACGRGRVCSAQPPARSAAHKAQASFLRLACPGTWTP